MSKAYSSPDDPKPSDSLSGDEKIHAQALEIFELCVENEADNRIDFKDDLTFARLGEQWPVEDRRRRELEGRPCLTVNKMPAFIRQVVNDARQNKPGIIVHPADDDADPDTAEVMEGLIRNIEVTSNADIAYDTALDFAVSAAWGYIRVNTVYTSDDTFEQDLVIEPVADPLTVYGDPFDNGADSAKWNHAFVVSTLTRDDFERKYPRADKIDWEGGPYADLPPAWANGEQIVVAEYWHRVPSTRQIVALSDGDTCGLDEYNANKKEAVAAGLVIVGKPRTVQSHKVVQYTMSGCEILETVEWAGRYIPIIPVYGEDIMVDGKRRLRSMVRDAKDSQRRVNFHTSAVTELVALAPRAPFIGEEGAFEVDQAKWETANSESHAYLEYSKGKDKPERQAFAGVPAGEMQQVLLASDDMKAIMGLHDASLGARSNETSGVAIKARQHEGDVSTFNFTDNLTRAIRHLGRVLLDMIPEVYSVARVIRVMGQDGTPKKVSINQPPGVGHNGGPPMGDEGEDVAKDFKIYNLTVGKYDLVVKAGPAFSTRREEAAAQMMEFVERFPQAAPVIGDLLAKNLDWPGADEIAKRLHALLPPALQAVVGGPNGNGQAPAGPPQPGAPGAPQPPLSPEALQAHQMLAQATQAAQALSQKAQEATQVAQQAQAELAALQADRSLETQKNDIAAYAAETARMVAENTAGLERVPASATTP